jgi:hypothetical protein
MDSSVLARSSLAVDPRHDNRHPLGDSPVARESSPYMINLPEMGIAGFIYFWVNGQSEAGAILSLFGPGVGDKPITQLLPNRPVPREMDFADFRIDGFHLQQDLQFNRAQVSWVSDEATLDFTFEAFHPPYAYGSNTEGCPAYTAADRIEQSGYMKGRFTIRGRTFEVDDLCHRDHSWGTRDWGFFQHYNWFEGQTRDGVAVHFWRFLALGRLHLRGYVYKQGLLAEITDLKLDVSFRDDLWQDRAIATLTDEAGRTTEVVIDFYAHYTLVPDPIITLREGAARATFDGKPGIGWMEVAWSPAYLDYVGGRNASSDGAAS